MGLSRRKFTREVKMAAIQRLEMGASVAESLQGGGVQMPSKPKPAMVGHNLARYVYQSVGKRVFQQPQ